ncbi:restriction endonuclease subunit S [Accumulibacter sp.]|uniref:restriction endonuclease subunit S n=1 Tax=Accumulibacter sp. TaxID=2053492 RepID=UPI00262421F7|nr:restriction endonuclease subunit S [Accumulibacter sp.]
MAIFPMACIADIAEVKGGKRMPANAFLVKTPTSHPYVRGRDIRYGKISIDEPMYVRDEDFEPIRRYTVNRGDVCITIVGNIGDVGITPPSLHGASLTENAVKLVNLREDIDARFLAFSLLAPEAQSQMKRSAAGAAQPKLGIYKVNEIRVAVPPLPVQQRIAGILSAYDELIENSQRRIKILESMARALYREWFVHFRFPGHENHPRVASSLGEIPQGWEVKKLGDVAEGMRRNVPKGHLEEPKPFVGLEHIPRRSLALDAWETITDLGSNKLEFKKGEVLFGKIRPYFHKVSVAPFDGLCSADTIVIRSRRAEHYVCVVACVFSDAFVAEASATANGAKMPRANWDVLKKFPIVIPNGEVAGRFSGLVTDILAKQQALIFQIQNLRRTRDLLLPRLLSGQIEARPPES